MENIDEEYERYFYEQVHQKKISAEEFKALPLHIISSDPTLIERYESSLLMQTEKDKVIESDLYKCPKCGSRKIKITQYQASRADEAPKVMFVCSNCGNKWSKS